ncbi:hypothetical protein RF11_07183 [Thelohanellus kitauei]|uniref:Uncharacterized protein n=1 Tax=Thelohanellus kitauei TaxID=669202 RepID=A0A0C2ND75_THEKT|nr:hypothetical protein RF11_07183 [Thelohanellus kitauei]
MIHEHTGSGYYNIHRDEGVREGCNRSCERLSLILNTAVSGQPIHGSIWISPTVCSSYWMYIFTYVLDSIQGNNIVLEVEGIHYWQERQDLNSRLKQMGDEYRILTAISLYVHDKLSRLKQMGNEYRILTAVSFYVHDKLGVCKTRCYYPDRQYTPERWFKAWQFTASFRLTAPTAK